MKTKKQHLPNRSVAAGFAMITLGLVAEATPFPCSWPPCSTTEVYVTHNGDGTTTVAA